MLSQHPHAQDHLASEEDGHWSVSDAQVKEES